MDIESIRRTVVIAAVVVNGKNQIVGTVVMEYRIQHKRVPTLRAVEVAGVNQRQVRQRDVIGGTGKRILGGVSQVDIDTVLVRHSR